ncbi:hypothetical protein UFOVP7_49 [uncultured Caudovirales phage]|uniref:Uncharacterized protein n=1 Tax=uncultured Caudovirales phage TaxID=2100421 RepID=A0A6J5KJ43_9CAUD|nr:hypothetical protein UFOVP7_49 [uncultured Caudovirales phage]
MPVIRRDDLTYSLAANASSTATGTNSGNGVSIPGGEYMFMVEGTVGASTISLQIKSPNGVWMDVQVFTGAVVKFTTLPGNQSGIALPAGLVRMNAIGGSPTGLYAYLLGNG